MAWNWRRIVRVAMEMFGLMKNYGLVDENRGSKPKEEPPEDPRP